MDKQDDEAHAVSLETESTVPLEQLHRALGDQYIQGRNDRDDLMYLSALAMECYDGGDYDLVSALMEFLRNNSTANLDRGEAGEVEEILRRAYNRDRYV